MSVVHVHDCSWLLALSSAFLLVVSVAGFEWTPHTNLVSMTGKQLFEFRTSRISASPVSPSWTIRSSRNMPPQRSHMQRRPSVQTHPTRYFVQPQKIPFIGFIKLVSAITGIAALWIGYRQYGYRIPQDPCTVLAVSGAYFGDSPVSFAKTTLHATVAADWDAIWSAGLAPGQRFDAAQVEPALAKLIASGVLPQGKALVPGCGRGYAVAALASTGRHVVGLEISLTAQNAAMEYLQTQNLPAGQAEVRVEDFFQHQGQYDLIYDCTFLCAIPPELRLEWAVQMKALLRPGGQLVLDIYPIMPGMEPADGQIGSGPPFAMSERLIRDLLSPLGFQCLLMEDVPEVMQARKARGWGEEKIAIWERQ